MRRHTHESACMFIGGDGGPGRGPLRDGPVQSGGPTSRTRPDLPRAPGQFVPCPGRQFLPRPPRLHPPDAATALLLLAAVALVRRAAAGVLLALALLQRRLPARRQLLILRSAGES